MKIGIFGGTFNPLHKGHLEIAKVVKETMSLDEVWLIPTFKTPNKRFDVIKDEPKKRFLNVKKTVNSLNYDWLKIKDFEQKLKGVSYTYKTLEYLKKKHPKNQYFLIIGDDHYPKFDEWKNAKYIQEEFNVIFVRRSKEVNLNLVQDKKYIYIRDIYFPISSTDILKNAKWSDIHEKTKPFIAKDFLYIKELVYFRLNNSKKNNKYVHSLSVANHAKKLSQKWKYQNVEKAYYAGLAHDLFKNDDPIMQTKYIMKNSDYDIPPLPAAHGYYAAIWFENEYKINDKEFVDAIKKHTLAEKVMTKLDKIIFVADKIADDRTDEVSKRYRKLAYKNLDLTFYYLLLETVKKLEKKNIIPSKHTLEAIKENKV